MSGAAPTRRVVVAVDGPAGSGKSSVSKAVARRLGYDFLDTGAAYRALAWWALERGIALDDADAVRGLLPDFDYALTLSPDHLVFRVGGTDVTAAIREPRVSSAVSSIARVPEVREHLTALFRDLMLGGNTPGVITEGRDITTVVAPDATVRVLLTASEEARQGRRAAELTGENADDVGRRLRERDAQDLTVVDFMTAADGVTTLDSTSLTFDETVDALAELIRRTVGDTGTTA